MRKNQREDTKASSETEGGAIEWEQGSREEDETKCVSSKKAERESGKRQDRNGGTTKNQYRETKRTLLQYEHREGKGKNASDFELQRSCLSN